MAKFEPWTEEPMGDDYCYMTRVSDSNLRSRNGFQWPRIGYVECESWEGDDLKLAMDHHGFGKKDGGLWGFPDGWGNYRIGSSHYSVGVHQLVKIAKAEIRYGVGRSCRVPRGWVVCTGSMLDVARYLLNKGETEHDMYAVKVGNNFFTAIAEAQRPLSNIFDYLRESELLFMSESDRKANLQAILNTK